MHCFAPSLKFVAAGGTDESHSAGGRLTTRRLDFPDTQARRRITRLGHGAPMLALPAAGRYDPATEWWARIPRGLSPTADPLATNEVPAW